MNSFDLTKLGPFTFEHLVNQLALRVLGAGHSTFGPGSDGGRDGYFEGSAPYPSTVDNWSGRWFIQCKYHAPHLTHDSQKWLIEQVKDEIAQFKKTDSRRTWPDNWIVVSNIDPSGAPMSGAFDRIKALVKAAKPKLAPRFHLWGGNKLIQLLAQYPDIAAHFGHFLTPGHVISEMMSRISDESAAVERVTRYFIATQFEEYQYTKLEQAGSSSDARPAIQKLFIDVPFADYSSQIHGLTLETLVKANSRSHRPPENEPRGEKWLSWQKHPARAGIWFVRGGPGRGKSTVGQYFCQIQRAALILQNDPPLSLKAGLRATAQDVATASKKHGYFPDVPRIPVQIDLKDYSAWILKREKSKSGGVLSYITDKLSLELEQPVLAGLLLRMFANSSWFIAFDGLDEVPNDSKDLVAKEIRHFLENVLVEQKADVFALCTSRPQGYSGQFNELFGATLDLINLTVEQALLCAKPVLAMDRSEREFREAYERLEEASRSESVQQLMTTPLQSHIMAIVVRDGGKPPERRWILFKTFYTVIKRRESNKNFPSIRLAKLLREDDRLLKTIHNRLGFALQARAEISSGAESFLTRVEFESLVRVAVKKLLDRDIEETVRVVLEATTERLVLVSTPESGSQVKFDVRQLQEFFAAEFLYESVDVSTLSERLQVIAGDAHWREVIQFCISALVENERTTEVAVATQVLANLNTSSQDDASNSTARRLARGAIIASRLLSEGVLEQDRRIRHQFAPTLSPILSASSYSDILPLINTFQPNSSSWLIEHLMTAISTLTPSENIGAALALSYVISDSDDRRFIFLEYLRSAETLYSSFVVSFRMLHRGRKGSVEPIEDKAPQKWIISSIIENLSRSDWASGQLGAHFWVLSPILENLKRYSATLKDSLVGPAELWALRQLTASSSRNIAPGRRSSSKLPGLYGIRFNRDWVDVLNLNLKKEIVPHLEFNIKSGVFELVRAITDFARIPTCANLISASECLLRSEGAFQALMETPLLALLPIDLNGNIRAQLERLISLSSDEYDKFVAECLAGEALNYPLEDIQLDLSKVTQDSWGKISNIYPLLAAETLVGELLSENRLSAFGEQWTWHHVAAIWERSPVVAGYQFPLAGKVIQYISNSKIPVFSQVVSIGNSNGCEWRGPRFYREVGGVEHIFPFALDLPNDTHLLDYALEAIYNGVFSRENGYSRDNAANSMIEMIGLWVSGYIKDVKLIHDIANDVSYSDEVRLAAAFLCLMHPQNPIEINEAWDLVSSNFRLKPPIYGSKWKMYAVVKILSIYGDPGDTGALRFLATLIEVSRKVYWFRQNISLVISGWRERSFAPVTLGELEEKWLVA